MFPNLSSSGQAPQPTEQGIDLKALRAATELFAKTHLAQCAAEVLQLQETGVLADGKFRQLQRMCTFWTPPQGAQAAALALVHWAALEAVAAKP